MDRFERGFFNALMDGEPQPHDSALIDATEFDAITVAHVARRHLLHRDAVWGLVVGLTALSGVGFAAWYTPTNTVTITKEVEDPTATAACKDALNQAAALFEAVSKIAAATEERAQIEHEVADAFNVVDKEAAEDASARFFAKNEEISTMVLDASKIDLGTPAGQCRG